MTYSYRGGGAPLIPTRPPTSLPRRGPIWGLWESHPQLPAPTPPPRPGSETSCLPGSGQLRLWEAGGAGAARSPPPARPTGLWGPGGSVRGGGHGLAPGRPSGGAGAASALGGKIGRPVANGAGAGEGDTAGSPISRVPRADVTSSRDSIPACHAPGGPRPSSVGTRLLPSHLSLG